MPYPAMSEPMAIPMPVINQVMKRMLAQLGSANRAI